MKKGYLWGDDEENMALQAYGEVGENVWIVPPLTAAVGKYVSIGDGTYANMNLTLIDDWKIAIGKNVLFGPNVTLSTTGHPVHPKHRADGMYSFPITIEDNVWIGANVVAFGSPCRVYREINGHDEMYYFKDRRFEEQP